MRTDQQWTSEWKAVFNGLRPLSSWGIHVDTIEQPTMVELVVTAKHHTARVTAGQHIAEPGLEGGGYVWLLGGTALALVLYVLSIVAGSADWSSPTVTWPSLASFEWWDLSVVPVFLVLAYVPYYFCIRIWRKGIAPGALTQGYLGWEAARRNVRGSPMQAMPPQELERGR